MDPRICLDQLFDLSHSAVLRSVINIEQLQFDVFFFEKCIVLRQFLIKQGNALFFIIAGYYYAQQAHPISLLNIYLYKSSDISDGYIIRYIIRLYHPVISSGYVIRYIVRLYHSVYRPAISSAYIPGNNSSPDGFIILSKCISFQGQHCTFSAFWIILSLCMSICGIRAYRKRGK